MGTLNIKFNKYWYKHTLATLKWRLEWKLQMSKTPWGKLYRHFWRKRLTKRIMEVANEISQRSIRETHLPGSAVTLNFPDYDMCVHKKDILEKPLTAPVGYVPYVPLFPPLGLVEPPIINPAQLKHGLVAPAGVAIMDPTKIYKITPDIVFPEFPVIRRRICHLRKGKPWKFYTKPC
jgi:hypothetical protein